MTRQHPSPCILVIFGATGDLTARKLLPALYNLWRDKLLSPDFICVGIARKHKTHEAFRDEQEKTVTNYSRSGPVDPLIWKNFATRLFYHVTEFSNKEAYSSLHTYLDNIDTQYGTRGNRIYYLSTQPQYFPIIIKNLYDNHMLPNSKDMWSRAVIEKPFGRDLVSSQQLQNELVQYLDEEQIYRVDHYLGKESVQNIPICRFANPVIESLWNYRHVDCVQITIAEEIGIGTRGHFFEREGLLRDLIQNHMMQLLSLIAMELPRDLTPYSIQNEKVRVLKSIKPLTNKICREYAVRGQYGTGEIDGRKISSYREEREVNPNSQVETYVAMKLFIDNARWKGVPFYIRGGKRLQRRVAEITIVFHPTSYPELKLGSNYLSIRIQPSEGISLTLYSKSPGFQSLHIQPVQLDFSPESFFHVDLPEAYERLLRDCILGDNTLFIREDEVMASWKILTPLLKFWEKHPIDFPNYAAGSWGPTTASDLLHRDGRTWMVS